MGKDKRLPHSSNWLVGTGDVIGAGGAACRRSDLDFRGRVHILLVSVEMSGLHAGLPMVTERSRPRHLEYAQKMAKDSNKRCGGLRSSQNLSGCV